VRQHARRVRDDREVERVCDLSQEVDVELEPAALAERTGPDTRAAPVDDRLPRHDLRLAAGIGEPGEAVAERYRTVVLVLQVLVERQASFSRTN
jgi:hypothetical protein